MKSKKDLLEEMASLDAQKKVIQRELDIIFNENLKKEKDDNKEFIRRLIEIDFLKIWTEPHTLKDCSDADPWNSKACNRCHLIEIMNDFEWNTDYKVELTLEISAFEEYRPITIP